MKARQMIASIVIMLTAVLILNGYIGAHILAYLREWWPGMNQLLFWIVFGLIALSYLIGFARYPWPLRAPARLLKVIGSYYLAVMEFLILLLPVVDIIYGIMRLAGAGTTNYVKVAGSIVLFLLLMLMIWGSRNAWNTVIRRHLIHVDKQAGGLKQLRIAAASDLHLGNIVGKRHLKKLVREMNAMQPDLILLPGDVLDDSIEPFLRNRLGDTIKQLKARHGVFAILGNHEYYGRSIEKYTQVMQEIGIKVLQDETVEVAGSYYVAGRKDRSAEAMDPQGRLRSAELLAGVDHARPVILLDHQPYEFDKAAEAGADLLLCGHTHRGQIAPNHLITRRLFELDWGYMRKNRLHVFVSSGYGTWGPPIRLGSRSEILDITVTFES
ncbi:metallophosphoesterase [Paenibacillus sp. GCM10012307]|uniref:Metallophosphoesterase n=1 Tax=Paenibacillus roseus TaxID=2798579 RepID=A0A934MMV3_9BACL|nr:metallophosphoesterase [Paenibacillus roseus]MBJ6360326.1 metallophosphoesterase [Paenibacillus roseus]